MRQLTNKQLKEALNDFSKLPMRQLTIRRRLFFCECLSKLPMRQLTEVIGEITVQVCF